MKNKKNSLSLILIACSLALVLALQVLWLRGSFKDAKAELTKEVNRLFLSTVLTIQDSLIQKNIIPFKGDSARPLPTRYFSFRDSARMPRMLKDSVFNFINLKSSTVRVEVFSSTVKGKDHHSDQAIKAMISRATQLQKKGGSSKNFIINIGIDSLKMDSLTYEFSQAMRKAKIDLPFTVLKNPKERKEPDGTLVTEIVPINPMCNYGATVTGVDFYLWKKIAPQILFSVFSTLLTTFSFFALYKSLRGQQQLMELKNNFISNITHELKTPIATVSVALEALKDFDALKDPKRTDEYLTMAQNELSRLTLLTDNVLKMTTLETKGLKFLKERVSLNEIIDSVLKSMRLIFEKNQATVSFSKEGESFDLDGSDVHLTNLVYNLIDNAIKYSNSPIAISIHLEENDNRLLFSVKDNGIGIPKEYQKKIFDKFFRVPTGNVHNTHGYGLGLNYVAEVIGQHNGTIQVESESGLGSKFIVQFPKHHRS